MATWKLSADVSILPFGLDVMLRMRDGSISAFQGMLLSEDSLRARCESSGSLDKDKLKIEAGAAAKKDTGVTGRSSIQKLWNFSWEGLEWAALFTASDAPRQILTLPRWSPSL